MVTKQLGPGMFQQFQTQECEQCNNVKFARESETLQVTVEPGMKDNEVCLLQKADLVSILQPFRKCTSPLRLHRPIHLLAWCSSGCEDVICNVTIIVRQAALKAMCFFCHA